MPENCLPDQKAKRLVNIECRTAGVTFERRRTPLGVPKVVVSSLFTHLARKKQGSGRHKKTRSTPTALHEPAKAQSEGEPKSVGEEGSVGVCRILTPPTCTTSLITVQGLGSWCLNSSVVVVGDNDSSYRVRDVIGLVAIGPRMSFSVQVPKKKRYTMVDG
jgi:hypothetical protein